MRNIKLSIEYDGKNYAGWQIQNNAVTIQETIESAIASIVCEKVVLYGSGRTDAGVHAQGQIANFKTTSLIPSLKLILAINSVLPKDIIVNEVCDVHDDFHSRFSAKWKVYKYTVFNGRFRPVLNRDFCHALKYPLNHENLKLGAEILKGKQDFSAFKTGALPDDDNVRVLKRLDINIEGNYLYFTFEGNGFLRNMVRRIVGVLLELGRGKIDLERFKFIFKSKDPILGKQTAPAKGLCLMEVKY